MGYPTSEKHIIIIGNIIFSLYNSTKHTIGRGNGNGDCSSFMTA
jgi:hypothetical protein